jgi:hypothetical protein
MARKRWNNRIAGYFSGAKVVNA